jgi:hypothetical protein
MHDNYRLCETLGPKEYCIVVEQYKEGLFGRKFHEHMAAHRLSEESLQYLLPALVMRFGESSR